MSLNWIFRFNISETNELIKVSPKCKSGVFYCFISSTKEAPSFNQVMSSIVSCCWEILVAWMDFEILEWVKLSRIVLPNITKNIIKIACLKIVNWIGRKPILHINITCLSMLLLMLVFWEKYSHCKIFILSW